MNKDCEKSAKYAKAFLDIMYKNGISPMHAEEDLNISRGYIQRCSKGKNRMSVDVEESIEEYLGIESIREYCRTH